MQSPTDTHDNEMHGIYFYLAYIGQSPTDKPRVVSNRHTQPYMLMQRFTYHTNLCNHNHNNIHRLSISYVATHVIKQFLITRIHNIYMSSTPSTPQQAYTQCYQWEIIQKKGALTSASFRYFNFAKIYNTRYLK